MVCLGQRTTVVSSMLPWQLSSQSMSFLPCFSGQHSLRHLLCLRDQLRQILVSRGNDLSHWNVHKLPLMDRLLVLNLLWGWPMVSLVDPFWVQVQSTCSSSGSMPNPVFNFSHGTTKAFVCLLEYLTFTYIDTSLCHFLTQLCLNVYFGDSRKHQGICNSFSKLTERRIRIGSWISRWISANYSIDHLRYTTDFGITAKCPRTCRIYR